MLLVFLHSRYLSYLWRFVYKRNVAVLEKLLLQLFFVQSFEYWDLVPVNEAPGNL